MPDLPRWLTDGRAAWTAEVDAWLEGVVPGTIEAVDRDRERPWSAVWTIRTTDSRYFFKAAGSGGHHEPELLVDVAAIAADLVPEILAVDVERAWLLLADHGEPLRGTDEDEQVRVLADLLPSFGQLQIDSVASVPRWLEIGVPDRRAPCLVEQLEPIIEGAPIKGRPVPGELRTAMRQRLADFSSICAELAHDAICHGDLHTGNVLTGARLIDWGDSSITHPFVAMFVPLQLAVPWLERIDRGIAARRLRDAYLSVWDQGTHKLFDKALWVGYIERAMNWVHMLAEAEVDNMAEWYEGIDEMFSIWVERYELIGTDAFIDALVDRPIG